MTWIEFFRRDCDICLYYSRLVARPHEKLLEGPLCACGHPALEHSAIHPHTWPPPSTHEFRHFDEGIVRVELASIIQGLE